MKADPTVRHGTRHRYRQGCRCDVCVAAEADYYVRRKARNQARAEAGLTPHGTESGYSKYGCRCEPCSLAAAAARRAFRQQNPDKVKAYARWWRAVNAESVAQATKAGDSWTGAELEIVARRDLPLASLARMLGRSYLACSMARHRALNDPKWMRVVGLPNETGRWGTHPDVSPAPDKVS